MHVHILILTCLFLVSCVPALIIAGATSSSSSKKSKVAWESNFRETNLEREKAGLEPLDWCEEAFKMKKSWATKDTDCKAKLKAEGKIN